MQTLLMVLFTAGVSTLLVFFLIIFCLIVLNIMTQGVKSKFKYTFAGIMANRTFFYGILLIIATLAILPLILLAIAVMSNEYYYELSYYYTLSGHGELAMVFAAYSVGLLAYLRKYKKISYV